MKLAAIAHLRAITRRTFEAAGTIRQRLARSEAEVAGWEEHDGTEVEEAIRVMAFEDES